MNKYDEKYLKIGKNIANHRRNLNMTQEELANKVGISYSYITQIEAPRVVKKMSLEVLFDISEALNIEITEIIN